jgi:hypothetical protein
MISPFLVFEVNVRLQKRRSRKEVAGTEHIGCGTSLFPVTSSTTSLSTRARLPEMPLGVTHSGKLFPGATAVCRLEQGRILRPSVNGVWVGRRGFETPDTFELDGRAVFPLRRIGSSVQDTEAGIPRPDSSSALKSRA